MLIDWLRYRDCPNSTAALVFVNNEFECYGCEDEYRARKKPGQTRIPPGKYEITLRAEGGMHGRYSDRFPWLHKGMLWLRDVPDFEWVYIHIGNDHEDTEGCLLVGLRPNRGDHGDAMVFDSTPAYCRLYEKVIAALGRGERVFIDIRDIGV